MVNPNKFRASIDTGLGVFPGAVSDPALQKELSYLYRAVQNLQLGIDRIERGTGIYDAAITYGQLVSITNSAGVAHVKLATAAVTPSICLAFCPTPENVSSGAVGEIQTNGLILGLSGLTPGAIYYLSDTVPGGYQTIAPVGVGKIVQVVGFAVDATTLCFRPSLTYTQL